MIFPPFRRLIEHKVLGINRRNADYLMPYNPRSSYPLVDDKVTTKRLADKYGIPTPLLHAVVARHGDIAGVIRKVAALPRFVVKPARGAGGSGILLIADYAPGRFIKQNAEMLTHEDLSYHLSSIISGIYSLGGSEDCALIEDLIQPDPVFSTVTYRGVPDIRVIVYRCVPVMAMVRLPTRASDGKANLHRGAIGVGIDIQHGVTTSGVHHSLITLHHPDTGYPVGGIQVPQWEKVLSMAVTSAEMTGLGYLGVDLIIDRERGPLLLELNARPGLAIQMANRIGLQGRLEQVNQAPQSIFANLENRLSWAIQTFGSKAGE